MNKSMKPDSRTLVARIELLFSIRIGGSSYLFQLYSINLPNEIGSLRKSGLR